jgi:hypothetical protein
MNSIERSIIRGLLSGEIKASPQVFEHLRKLSERRVRRHLRIVRLVRPNEVRVPRPNAGHREALGAGPAAPSPDPPATSPVSRSHRTCSRFARLPFGRWIRLGACLGVLGGLASLGTATVYAGDMSLAGTAGMVGAPRVLHAVITPGYLFPGVLMAASGALLVGLLAVLGGQWYFRNRLFVMKPHEVALDQLEAAERGAQSGDVQGHHQAVLDILHRYLQAQLRLSAPDMQRDEFLKTLTRDGGLMTGYHQSLLVDVLDAHPTDSRGTREQISGLTRVASGFVWATACYRPARGGGRHVLVGTTGAMGRARRMRRSMPA